MYDLEKTWDTGLRLRLQRRSVYLHRLVFFAGAVFMLAGVVLFFLGAPPIGAITPFGSGLALVFGACFLLEFHRGRPRSFAFDHADRVMIVEERDGSETRLGMNRFRELRMRRQGRRWIVYLAAFDGSYWDLSSYGGRRQARDLIGRLNERLFLGNDPKSSPQSLPKSVAGADAPGYHRLAESPRTYFWWRDSLTPRGTFFILGLLAGFALVAAGLLADQIRDPLIWQIAGAGFGVLAIYLVFSALRGFGRLQVIAVDAETLSYGTGRAGADRPRFRPGKTVPRASVVGLWHSFDLQAGLQRFLLVDEDARRALAALYTDDRADFSAAWRAVGVRFRTPGLSLPGLSIGDVVRLREELEEVLFAGADS